MWDLRIDDQIVSCRAVTHIAAVGRASHLRLDLSHDPRRWLGAIPRVSKLSLSNGGAAIALAVEQLCHPFGATGSAWAWPDLLAGRPEPEDRDRVPEDVTKRSLLVIDQRRAKEPIRDLLGRAANPRVYSDFIMNKAKDEIEAALPEGACILSREGESPARRGARAVASLARGSRAVVGAARTLAAAEWCVVTFNPAETAPETAIELEASIWRPAVTRERPPGEVGLEARVSADDPWAVLTALVEPKATDVSAAVARRGGDALQVPIRPMTISHGGLPLFAAEIAVRFDLMTGRDQLDTTVSIHGIQDPVCAPAGPNLSGAIVLARIAASQTDPFLVAVKPADPVDAGDEGLSRLPAWKSGDQKPIEALQTVPAYARKDRAAFYARWREGDLVLVRFDDGRIPLVLGAPRRRMETFETDAGPEVVLHGRRLRQIAEADDGGKRSTIELGDDGRAAVAAPDELKLTDGITVSADKVAIRPDTTIDGQVSIKGNAAIGGQLDVGKADG